MSPPTIFVSYRADDEGIGAAAVRGALERRFGRDAVFLDGVSLRAGERYPDGIRAAVLASKVMVVLVGRRWLTLTDPAGGRRIDDPHDWVRREVALAARRSIPLVPVLVEGARPPRPVELPADVRDLAYRQAVPLGRLTLERDLGVLADHLQQWVTPSPEADPVPTGSQWVQNVRASDHSTVNVVQGSGSISPRRRSWWFR